MTPRMAIGLGTTSAGVAVALGAFGAHGLETQLPRWYGDPAIVERMKHTWEVAVRYQVYQALGLILLGLWGEQRAGRCLSCAAIPMLLGSLIFSGLLYALVLTGQRWMGAIVPIGGVLMIVGWGLWSWKALFEPPTPPATIQIHKETGGQEQTKS